MLRNKSFVTSLMFILFSCFVFGQSYQDWKWVHPTPQGNTLRYVKRFDANTWYGVGLAGTFLKTTDGGATFFYHHNVGRMIAARQHANLMDAHFFDKQNGIVVGSTGSIARTTDGGVTFDTLAANPLTTSNTAYKIYFVDNNLGFISASSGILLKTTDGGATWATVATGVTSALYDVWSPDGTLIIVATTSGNTRRSTDGGVTWTAVNTGATSTINRMVFTSSTTGFVAGSSSYCRVTTDAGLTWAAANTGIPTGLTFYDIDNVGSTIYLTGYSYSIFKSTDNGATWDTLGFIAPVSQQPWTSTYYSASFGATEDTLLVGGAFGLLNHNTGMNNRTLYTRLLKPGTHNDVWSSADGQKIIVVGAPSITGSIFDQFVYSTNGGSTWKLSTINKNGAPINSRAVFVSEETSERDIKGESPKSPTSTSAINSIQMLTEQMGYAVGSNSAVYKTTNGGMTWDSLTTTITAAMNLSKVFFLNANVGWVTSKTANASGTIFKTTDAGATWTQQSLGNGLTGSSTQVYGFQMLNENVGWALNYTPRPYKTTDGGATWTLQNLVDNFGGFLYDVKMFDENNGFLVGSSGRVYKTTNSGTNWDTVSIPTRSYALYKLLFVDANNAFISGATGTIFKSTNGGSTWDLENTAGSTMYSIAASGVNNGEVTLFSVGTLGYGFKRTLSVTTPTTITVTAPNGGETWVSGSTKNITWSSSGVANVKIELTTDNGTTWSTISASTPATPASYSWTVPAVNSTQCKIMISDVANAAINDMSNASFSITTAVLIDIPMSVAAGWNMAAVSVLAPNMTASVLFSGSNASVFGFDNGYVAVTDLVNGKGYWVRYAAPATFTISGTAIASTTVPIVTGWNMVGIYKDTVTVAGITTTPAGIVNSNYFGFDNGYVNAAKLAPGKGYWVRATQAGTLNLPTPTAKFGVGNTAVNSTGKIIITDKNGKTGVLYSATSESELNRSDLPPVPPVGTFDVRFATQRNAAVFGSDKQLVNIEGAQYPVTLRSEGLTLTVTDRATNGKLLNATIANGQSIVISDASLNAIEIGATLAPVAFALSQNYPNPFNPSTIIRFTLPEKSRMSLTVYNQLGQKVATIADGIKEAGSYNVEFNGSQLSSGVYFYELKTEKNTAIKKLMLMK